VIYDFRIRAKNNIGFGAYSDYLRQGFSALPAAPVNLRRVESVCSKSQIAIKWNAITDGIKPSGIIRGYMVYMANDTEGLYNLYYNGTDRPLITSWIATGTVPGILYRFKVSALVFNGEGPLSSEFATYSCVIPTKMASPQRVASTATTMTLSWTAP
jgi:hypothetical protein